MSAIVSDGRWQAAKDAGRLIQVSELEKGDRFVDSIGGECTYEFADGAERIIVVGWLKVARL